MPYSDFQETNLQKRIRTDEYHANRRARYHANLGASRLKMRGASRAWRAAHPEEARAKARIRQEFINDYKSTRGCALCRENRHPAALDLHHLDPATKHPSLKVGGRAMASLPMLEIPAECAKCLVLCATCHRLVEAGILKI
jgi:hypothetical protein